jgi:excisionase family DNA binding protein
MNNEAEQLMSSEELRRWLGLGKTKTQELLQSGAIPSYRIGRRRIIRCQDVERFLEENRYEPGV